jgi:uncharacterized protein
VTDVTPRLPGDALVIQDYTPDGFCIGGADYRGAVVIAAGQVHPLGLPDVKALAAHHVDVLKEAGATYLVIGTGARTALPPAEVLRALKEMGIVAEPMPTGAACRTFNVLLAEGRQVAALLFPV